MTIFGEWLDVFVAAALAAWEGLCSGASVTWSNVVEAVLTFHLTPAVENALIVWCIVCGAGSFVAAALAARRGRRG